MVPIGRGEGGGTVSTTAMSEHPRFCMSAGRVDACLNDSSALNPHCTQFFLASRHGSGDQGKLVLPPILVLVRRWCIEKATRVSRISAPMASAANFYDSKYMLRASLY